MELKTILKELSIEDHYKKNGISLKACWILQIFFQ
jgi:hypothetical protein